MKALITCVGFLLMAMLCSCGIAQSGRASDDIQYTDVPSPDPSFGVTVLTSQGHPVGCAAASEANGPPIVLTVMRKGGGALSLIGARYRIPSGKQAGRATVAIGESKKEMVYAADEGIVTFPFLSDEIAAIDQSGIIINKVVVDRAVYKSLRALVGTCLAK